MRRAAARRAPHAASETPAKPSASYSAMAARLVSVTSSTTLSARRSRAQAQTASTSARAVPFRRSAGATQSPFSSTLSGSPASGIPIASPQPSPFSTATNAAAGPPSAQASARPFQASSGSAASSAQSAANEAGESARPASRTSRTSAQSSARTRRTGPDVAALLGRAEARGLGPELERGRLVGVDRLRAGEELVLGLGVVRVGHAAVDRADLGALLLGVEADALGAQARVDDEGLFALA